MKILVTGNMGYVGPPVVERLRASHPDALLVGLDAGYFAHCLTGGSAFPERLIDCQYFGDVRSTPESLLRGIDAVVHLAAVSNDPISNAYEDVTLAINHRASAELARAAKRCGVKSFVFASSCSVYGFSEEGVTTEASPTNPLTPYARSKLLAERDLEAVADDSFTVTSLRFGTACGMSDRLRLDLVLNDFVAAAVASNCVTILSDGSPWRPLIHVRDMARAIDWAVAREPASAGPFLAVNVGSREWNYQIRDLAEAVAAGIPNVSLSIGRQGEPDKRSYKVDFSLFRKLAPGHQPEVSLPEAIEELRKGLEGMGFADREFRNSQLIRLRVLERLRESRLLTDQLEWRVSPNGHQPAR